MTSNALRIGMGFAAGALLGLLAVAPVFADSERFNVQGMDRVRGPYVGQIELSENKGKLEIVRSIRFEKGGEQQLRGAAERRGGQVRAQLSLAAGAAGALSGQEAGEVQLQLRLEGSHCWTRTLDGQEVVALGQGAHPGEQLTFADDLAPKGKGKGKANGKLQSEHSVGIFPGLAFIKGKKDSRLIHPNDPEQGGLGDCYLVSAMIALALRKPYMIHRLIKTNRDGTFTVRLYGLGSWGKNLDVKIDNKFPAQGKLFAYGGSSDTKVVDGKTLYELWPSLIEKAYAKHRGSYNKIEGGHSDVPFEFLTGKSASSYLTFFRSASGVRSLVDGHYRKGHPICIGSKSNTGKLGSRLNVTGSHVYVVWKAKGGKYTLYNPWQSSHPSRPVTAKELKALASHVYVGKF
jgi:calpain family cysteine protease